MNNEIIQLFTKYLNNQCSKTELEKVLVLIEEGGYKNEWEFVLTEDAARFVNTPGHSELPLEKLTALHDKIQYSIAEKANNGSVLKLKSIYWRRITAAAVILITLSVGTFHYYSAQNKPADLVDVILPGGNKAVLTLANGEKIILTDAENGELAAQSGVVVTKLADGQIVYTVKSDHKATATTNSIETPKGGQYQVILPDGSKVLLNAASRLTYPASFAELKERRVQLTGEAYFEVAKEEIPFIVVTDKQEVKVLGTHFNINSYADEPVTRTTLVEGSVLVAASGIKKVLVPGNQAVLGAGGLTVSAANIEEVLSWKNGYFMFDSENIESVMRKISRWYDVEVVYEGAVPEDRFGGTTSRYEHVSKVLKILGLTNKVHFKIEGRRIIVTK